MILITGGAGYIGSHCAINLLNKGYELVIFDNLENGHIETINTLKSIGKVNFIKGDLRNVEDIENVFKNYNIDAVMHFAGYIEVSESVENPSKYYKNNIIGSLNLFDIMIKYDVKHIVFSSTCAIYGNVEYMPLDEKHPKQPINPYGQTKLIIEEILEDYDKAYGLKSVCLRYFNAAGADSKIRIGEWHEPESHLIPNILKSIFDKNKTFKIYGNDYNTPDGTCIRDYVNVEDLAQAHYKAYIYLKENNSSNQFNLGTEKGTSVKEVFSIAEKITGEKIKYENAPRRAGDNAILCANATKAKQTLNWKAETSIEKSIETAYQWEKTKH